jgi:hypothetical protein
VLLGTTLAQLNAIYHYGLGARKMAPIIPKEMDIPSTTSV